MQQEKKKHYEKPKLTKIRFDAKCAVLGFCKTPRQNRTRSRFGGGLQRRVALRFNWILNNR